MNRKGTITGRWRESACPSWLVGMSPGEDHGIMEIGNKRLMKPTRPGKEATWPKSRDGTEMN
jgi:hypothetical protein